MPLILVVTSCTKSKSELVWETNFYQIGSHSSPRTADLNEDGVLDIVVGAGRNENQPIDQGVIALDGISGKILWVQEAQDQVFGSATFFDITKDGTKDVFIGGRSPNFKALDGKNGQVFWEFNFHHETDSILKYARFNFYNSVLIPDQNNNQFPELLTVNGGNVKALPYSPEGRHPGVLMVFDSKDGEVLAAATMPDGKESYMSPLCFKQPDNNHYQVLFGTGGETISGGLYSVKLTDVMSSDLSNATLITSESGHGFIAPPVLADITLDGALDIVSISHGSTVSAVDGVTGKQIWKTKIPDTESSNSFAVGYFNEDQVPDFFCTGSVGTWPKSTSAVQVMLDGKTGEVAYSNSFGCVNFTSPVGYDLNNDGLEEVILSYSQFDCERDSLETDPLDIETFLVAIDFKDGSVHQIDRSVNFKNIFSTPWVGDLDADGYLDLVYSQCYSANDDILSFLGMRVKRVSLGFKTHSQPKWGSYMGTDGDGIFKK
ncbi:MAG: hypothetical protein DHS20C17_14840 [Cyclobacteriaceae bacterium]|nr:MAG: hypothetical protein DHS20C17_14840 [Cyclobacteriaceae bacterium]